MSLHRVPGPAGYLSIDDGGSDGVPVIFLHSFAGDSSHWSAQLRYLRRNRRAVAIDLRGHGRSEPPSSDDYSIEAMVEDVEAVVDELGIDRCVLVGHSLGGAVALAYAGKHPELVTGLVLVGAPGKVPKEQAEQIMSSMEQDYESVTDEYWKRLLINAAPDVRSQILREMGRIPRKTSLEIIRQVFEFDPLPSLKRYRGPKLAITTQHSEQSYDLHNLVPDLPHKVVTGASHWMQMDKPDELNRILNEFLSTTDRAEMRAHS